MTPTRATTDVAITFVESQGMYNPILSSSDQNIIVVKNPLSSAVPGATRVQVTLVTNTKVLIKHFG